MYLKDERKVKYLRWKNAQEKQHPEKQE